MAMTFFPSSVLAISLIAAESAFLKSAVMIFDFSETMIPSLAMAGVTPITFVSSQILSFAPKVVVHLVASSIRASAYSGITSI